MHKILLKVDISGIQNYIFDVPGDGAAKNLKGRSFFIHAITLLAEHYFLNAFNGLQKDVLYNGGGNLFIYLSIEKDEQLMHKIELFQSSFINIHSSLFPFIGFVAIDDLSFVDQMVAINKMMQNIKLRRPYSNEVYIPQNANVNDNKFKDFTTQLLKSKGYQISKVEHTGFSIGKDSFAMAGYEMKLTTQQSAMDFGDSILNKLPLTIDGNILEFKDIADQSIGDKKLAALKLDVDNLGILFRNRTDADYKILSAAFQEFFEKTLYQHLLRKEITAGNIYPVFAGGDDFFLIGRWDLLFRMAPEIHDCFVAFQNDLRHKVSAEEIKYQEITVSAGLVVFGANFPMIRVAEIAENALELAKHNGKNAISVFGEVLQWKEFKETQEMTSILHLLIEDGVSRSILERIKSSEVGFQSLQERAVADGQIDFPKTYRLKYYLRNIKNPKHLESLESLFTNYSNALIKDFLSGYKETNAAKFPVAARWTELLTKN